MPSNLSIVSSDVPSDAQPITMIAGEAIAKDQLLCFSPSQKVVPTKGTKDVNLQSLFIRTANDAVVVSDVIPLQGRNRRNWYPAAEVERLTILGNGNFTTLSSDANSPFGYFVNVFTDEGVLVGSAQFVATSTSVGAYVRKVDANRFAVIWILGGSGQEQYTFRYIIYNNDVTVSQALTTVVLPSNVYRLNGAEGDMSRQNFIVTSDGYFVAAFGGDSYYFFASWTLAGSMVATTQTLTSNTFYRPEMIETGGQTFIKIYDSSVGSSYYFRFAHAVAGSVGLSAFSGIGSASSFRSGKTTAIKFGNGVLVADRGGTVPQLIYIEGTTTTPLTFSTPSGATANDHPSVHDIGDGEAIAIFPTTAGGPFFAVRVDQSLKTRTSAVISQTFAGGTTYGWIFPKIFRTPDALSFTLVDYGATQGTTGYFIMGYTLPLDWPAAGAVSASIGTKTIYPASIASPYQCYIQNYSRGELRMLAVSESSPYYPSFRTVNIRKSSIIGVAAAAAAKDAPVVVKTKGYFILPPEQDYGVGLSFASSGQGVAGTGGRILGRNALLTGIAN